MLNVQFVGSVCVYTRCFWKSGAGRTWKGKGSDKVRRSDTFISKYETR